MPTLSPSQYGFLKHALGAVAFAAVWALLGIISNPANLDGLLNPGVAVIVVALAGSLEEYLKSIGHGPMFGALRVS